MARRQKHLVLLRGINVGGKNLIPMAELRECFEDMGFEDVRTYIQSGNVLFRGKNVDEAAIEGRLAERFDYPGRVVVMTGRRYLASIARAPEWWGQSGEAYRHNALFTLRNTTPARVLAALPPPTRHESIDTAPGVIFWSAGKDNLTRTMFQSKLAGHPLYKQLTIRNYNTVTRLAALLKGM
jgi:uncharacterized protein (DUF1697 family)